MRGAATPTTSPAPCRTHCCGCRLPPDRPCCPLLTPRPRSLPTCRRFLLEWLSFTHRYIPVGLLEVLPQAMHWRPPAFVGRSDLETLLGSDNAADWVALSEMLLGPAPPVSPRAVYLLPLGAACWAGAVCLLPASWCLLYAACWSLAAPRLSSLFLALLTVYSTLSAPSCPPCRALCSLPSTRPTATRGGRAPTCRRLPPAGRVAPPARRQAGHALAQAQAQGPWQRKNIERDVEREAV
jgi:hypothetical protein